MIKVPKSGFFMNLLAFVCSLIAMILFINTYSVGSYEIDRWAVFCSAVAVWFLAFLVVHTLFNDREFFWLGFVYVGIAFLLTYGMIKFLQPCLTPIGFVFGASDLNMGDTALNKVVANNAIVTTVFYVLAIVFTILGAFLPGSRSRKVKQIAG